MDLLPLNFPVFYQCAVKGNTNLLQYDAVSVLLLGKLRQDCNDIVIGDAEATGYVSGKKRIKKEIATQLTNISEEEARQRVKGLGFQDSAQIAAIIRELLTIVDVSPDTREKINNNPDNISVIMDAFMIAIKCPPKNVYPLGMDDKKRLALCYSKENAAAFMEDIEESKRQLEQQQLSSPQKSKRPEGRVLSAEEIEALLMGEFSAQDEEKSIAPEEIPPISCTYVFQDYGMDTHCFYELANVALSMGTTGLSDLFELPMFSRTPVLEIYDGFYSFWDHAKNNNIKVFYKFTVSSIDDYKIPHKNNICGIIMVDIDSGIVHNFLDMCAKKQSIKFIDSAQKLEYQSSGYSEIGSIFSGYATSAISNFVDYPVTMKRINSSCIDETLGVQKPIMVGSQLFKSNDGREICGRLLVSANMPQKLWHLYEEENTDN